MASSRGPHLVVSGGAKLDEYLRKLKRQAGNTNKGVKIGFPQGAGTTAGGAPYARRDLAAGRPISISTVDLHEVGQRGVEHIQKKIDDLESTGPPLAPSTIRDRRRKGLDPTRPLRAAAEGGCRDAVGYEVVDRLEPRSDAEG